MATADILGRHALREIAFIALFGFHPMAADPFTLQVQMELLLSSGPGTISAQGAVSVDGPEDPDGVYRGLVQALRDAGVSRNIYGVNIDAVIAVLLLKMLWRPCRAATYPASTLETAAFTVFP